MSVTSSNSSSNFSSSSLSSSSSESQLRSALPDLAAAIQENFVAYLSQFRDVPGIEFHDERDVVWFVSTVGAPGNHVARTRLDFGNESDEEVDAEAVEARLGEVLYQVGRRVDRLDWPIFPTDRPANVGAYLANLGLQAGEGGQWMVADLEALPDAPQVAGLRVERVTDAAALQVWLEASAAGFGGTVESERPYYDAYLRRGFGADCACQHYIGYWNDEPVTSSTLQLSQGMAGVYNVSTPPRFRRRGFAGAITRHTIEEARARGYRYACLTAAEDAASLYRKLGFTFYLRPQEYRWRKIS